MNGYNGKTITEYDAFVQLVEEIGFMPFSNNSIDFISLEGITEVEQWHTNLPTDPWPWRVAIEEAHRAAYAKIFDRKPGFLSVEWYPFFISARRKQRDFEDLYSDGLLSSYAREIYKQFKENKILATHEIKAMCGFTKESVSKYESAMLELQMHMLLTTNGMKRKLSASGEPFGWPATAYSTVEFWAGEQLMDEANGIDPKDAAERILNRILEFAPNADIRKAKRFAGV